MSAYSATSQGATTGEGLLSSLSRFSVLHGKKELPMIPDVRTIHVYDFDNTLFLSPLPNPKLWNGPTLGLLQQQDAFLNGGWWHDSAILAATGDGVEKEERKAWEGWWNEHIVSLVELSMAQKGTLNILLTGRSVNGFSELVQRIVASKKLDFDMICLKPNVGPDGEKIQNTKVFKTMFLAKLMDIYIHAEDLKIYEDRIGHVQAFEKFFTEYNARTGRKPIAAEVIQVAPLTHTLDPVLEVAEIQKLINDHNANLRNEGGSQSSQLHIKKQVFFTGYLLSQNTTDKLLELYAIPADDDIRPLATNIIITARRANQAVLHKAGGLNNQIELEVIGTGCWQDRVWAALVRSVDPRVKVYTDTPKPIIVLGHRRGAKPMDANMIRKWQEVPENERFRFQATVGERMLLRIESEEESLRFEREFHQQQQYQFHGHHGHHNQGHHHNHHYHHYHNTHQHGFGPGGPGGTGGEGSHRGGYGGHGGHDGYQGGMGGMGRGGGRKRNNHSFDDRRGGSGPRVRRHWD